MVERRSTFEGKPYILEIFESIDEFLKTTEARPITDEYSYDSTAKDVRGENFRDKKFRGANSYSEAKEQFINGTKVKGAMSKAFASEVDPRQRETVLGPCGCAPVVPLALMGVPNSMIDIRRKRVPKAVRLIVDMTVNRGIRGSDITEAGKKIIAAVGKLEGQGISTEIICTEDSLMNGHQYNSMGVTIKNAGQGFSAARVSFPMSSPAFLRVFSFIHTSGLEGCEYAPGYGRPLADVASHDKLRSYYRTMYGDGIYISLARVISWGESEITKAIEMWRKGR